MYAGETIMYASALPPPVTTERKANPKTASQLPCQDPIEQIHGIRNPLLHCIAE
jgi:hypothetical protein